MIIDTKGSHFMHILQKHAEKERVDYVDVPDDSRVWAFVKALRKERSIEPQTTFFRPLVALDPGETTGIAVWDPSSKRILLAQLVTKDCGQAYEAIFPILNYLSLDKPALAHVRYEDYRVYGHMTETHAFSNLHTARIIGVIEVICHLTGLRWTNALAQHAKTFWTDEKLKMCNVYNRGMRHARDAERHLLRLMCENDV